MGISQEKVEELVELSREIRKDIVRMVTAAGSGHMGGPLSSVEVIVALYFYKMRYNPKDPKWEDRDRFVLSKGHVCPTLYAVMAHAGYFPHEELMTLRKLGSRLQGHPHMLKLPGLETSCGSLGQGLSIANGMALGAKMDGKSFRVYCMMGDGETDEGQIWEAAMTAAHYKLDNVCGVVDHNGLQIDGRIEEVMNLNPIPDKWRAFGWHVIEVNGHDIKQICDALDTAETIKGKPTMIISHTIKGKGVSFMEGVAEWHGKAPKPDEAERALAELEAAAAK
ncbi:MAG: transketolase [bacterium]